MKQTFVAVHALIKKDNKFLITKRSISNDYMPGLWDIPGGTIKFGENIMAALGREVKEETNLIVRPQRILHCYGYLSNSSRHQFQLVYLCDYVNGKIQLNPREHSEFRWVGISELNNLKKIAFFNSLYQEIKTKRI